MGFPLANLFGKSTNEVSTTTTTTNTKVKKNTTTPIKVFPEKSGEEPCTIVWGEKFKENKEPLCQGTVRDLTGKNIGSFMVSTPTDFECTEMVGEDKMFQLNAPMTFNINYEDENGEIKEYKITIPKGYKWDGASIPSMFQSKIGAKNSPKFMLASLLHDYLCENKELVDKNRALSSCIFYEMLKKGGTDAQTANLMYAAVESYQYAVPEWDNKEVLSSTSVMM